MAKHHKKSSTDNTKPDKTKTKLKPKNTKPKKQASTEPAEAEQLGTFDEALSYVLRRAAASLRSALAEDLRPLELSAAQHACLELLGRSPGLSSSDLARNAFVSRQSMNLVLRGLQDRGLVTRPSLASQGRALPTTLTDQGRKKLTAANTVARAVEKRMLVALPEKRRTRFRSDLKASAEALAVHRPE